MPNLRLNTYNTDKSNQLALTESDIVPCVGAALRRVLVNNLVVRVLIMNENKIWTHCKTPL